MGKDGIFAMSDNAPSAAPEVTSNEPQVNASPDVGETAKVQPPPKITPWHIFLQTARPAEIKKRFSGEISGILKDNGVEEYCVLALLEPVDSIDSYELDQIFNGLKELNRDHSKDVMLILLSRGGSIESAYQISKLCKSFAKSKFVAVVPRHAKSAATLIALGADEIHMGPLGQLGPIDPQLGGGLPALGVSQALKTTASVAQEFPGSAQMFAHYLRMALTVEQIGYCDRISESAVQYAVRLLSTKHNLPKNPESVAKELVYEYKDHGFVIDIDEAKMHLGADWIKTETAELAAAEEIYSRFETVNYWLDVAQSKRLLLSGGATLPDSLLIIKNPKD